MDRAGGVYDEIDAQNNYAIPEFLLLLGPKFLHHGRRLSMLGIGGSYRQPGDHQGAIHVFASKNAAFYS